MKSVLRIGMIVTGVIILFLAAGCKKENAEKLLNNKSAFSSDSINNPKNNPVATDADGNIYKSVTIGKQIWLVENLKTTKYLNGDPIISNLRGSDWTNTSSGAYQISSNIYGNLYNAYAVEDGRQICPAGWHVPSATEWDELLNYLGGEDNAGGAMKESGTSHWLDPNEGATNESGFTALPAGFVSIYGDTVSVGSNTAWWSASKENKWYWTVQCSFASKNAVRTQWNIEDGLSVRCVKDSLNPSSSAPFVSTRIMTDITDTTAKSGGNITFDGNATILSRGVCWSTNARPTISDSKTADGTGIGQYASRISGLSAGTKYHVRAYATNSAGTRYGEDMTFSTSGVSPNVPTTKPATNVSVTMATLNGTVNAQNCETWVAFEYGTTTDYGQEATPGERFIYGNKVTTVYAISTLLKAGTVYHFRLRAENSQGTFYGRDMEFTTLNQAPPTVNGYGAENITSKTATLTGYVIANNLPSVVTFEYGTTTNYGQSVTSGPSPATGDSVTRVSAILTGLPCGAIYHFRMKAENSLGVTYGRDLTFCTKLIPTLTTSVSGITETTAIAGGYIIDEGCSPITDRGFELGNVFYRSSRIWKITHDGQGNGSFTRTLTGLYPLKRYYVRAYATNSAGTAYGNKIYFNTSANGK
jgi:uncharacterized protein (TIGR02145 family)